MAGQVLKPGKQANGLGRRVPKTERQSNRRRLGRQNQRAGKLQQVHIIATGE